MDTTALRQKLLDLAIRGRLVPQNPDEPAVELDAEDIVPESEQPFEIPENWRWVRLSQIAFKITDGTHHSPPNSASGDYLYITAKNIKNNGIDLRNVTYVTKKEHDEIYARCNPEKGDILYIKDGATTGVVTINQLEEPFSLLSSVALIKTTYNNKFIVHVMRSSFFQELIRGKMKGVAITRVTLKILNGCLLPFPPLPEQERIAAKLEQLFGVIDRCEEAQKQIADTATQLRTNLLQAAIQGRLVPQNPDEPAVELDAKDTVPESEQPFEIPENWRWSNFSGIASLISGRDLNTNQILASGQLPYITGASQIANEKLIASRWTNNPYTLSELNDAILVCKGSGVGKVAINNIGLVHIARQIMAIRAKTNKIIPSFLFLYIKAHSKIFTDKAQGLIPGISRKDVLSINIPIPPLQEQERIAAKLERLFAAIDTIQQAAI